MAPEVQRFNLAVPAVWPAMSEAPACGFSARHRYPVERTNRLVRKMVASLMSLPALPKTLLPSVIVRLLYVLGLVSMTVPVLHAQDFLPEYARGIPMDQYLPPPPPLVIGEPSDPKDAAAIDDLLRRFYEAWRAEDSEAVIDTYWPDVHWTNAFGLVLRGHQEMRAFFPVLFEQFDAAETAKGELIHLRFIGDDVAILQRAVESSGGNRDGDGPRQIQVTSVLQKRHGQWRTLHQMIMDVRL